MLGDSSLDFINSNTYDQTARTSGNINFSDLFKALKEDDKKVLCKAETTLESPSTAGNINTLGNDTSLHILDSGGKELVIFCSLLTREKQLKKLLR